MQTTVKEITTDSEELGEDNWWAGLHPCQMEKNAWVHAQELEEWIIDERLDCPISPGHP